MYGTKKIAFHNQVAGIVYGNIFAKYGLESRGQKWVNVPRMVENDQTKIVLDF